jgi:mevalonate kinase
MSEYVDEKHEEAVDVALDAKELRVQNERIGKYVLDKTRAYGKLILFGEHFVVYRVPALVGAVSAYTDCEAVVVDTTTTTTGNTSSLKPGVSIVDNRPAVPNYKVQKAAEGEEAVKLVLDHLKLDYTNKLNIQLTFGGTLTCASGIGASAAQVVSLARALKHELPVPMTEDEINAAGYEGEKGYHGTPSGIDNTAATFAGLLKFQRTDTAPVFTKFRLATPIRIVYASTGITASTTTVVNDVRAKKEEDPAWFDGLLQEYLTVVTKAEAAVLEGDMATLGDLLNQNHTLCQKLTVSCAELDALVEAARTAGAVGAKMSGTGRGGLMLALTPTVELQDAVAAALTAAGAPQVWKTTLA